MASIGELTATVRADISGYVGPMRQVAATTQQTAAAMQATGATAVSTLRPLSQMRGAFFDLAASAVGVRGKLSNAVEGLLLFGGGSAAVIAATAGIAVIGAAFASMRDRAEEARKPLEDAHQTIHDIMTDVVSEGRAAEAVLNKQIGDLRRQRAEMRRELSGRFSVSDPANIPEAALRGVSTAYAELSDQIANLEGEARNLNTTLKSQEGLEHTTHAVEVANDALREQERLLAEITQGFKRGGQAFDQDKADALRKQAQQYEAIAQGVKHAAEAERARADAQRDALRAGLDKVGVGDTKGEARDRLDTAMQSARDTASAMASAFSQAFSDKEKFISDRIAAALRAAIRAALAKLIAEKIFEVFLNILTGGAAKGVSAVLSGGSMGAPSASSAVGPSGAAIVVPLENLPAPRSPVEMARDQLHQAVWIETARVAAMNGVRLQPRFG